MIYQLARHHRKQIRDQWTECCRIGNHDLPAFEAIESKQAISGQNVARHESMTYLLLSCQRKQTGDQWTKCCRTGIYDLHTVEASQKANR